MLFVRVITAFCSFWCLAAAVVLYIVALTTPWWSTPSTAPRIGAEPSPFLNPAKSGNAADALNSEITLWGHVGCAKTRNETWKDICAITELACFKPPEVSEDTGDEWRPATRTTTTTPLPTLDPWRATTTPTTYPPTGDNCAKWGVDCPEDWGEAATEQGDGVAYGDSPSARVSHGSVVTAENPIFVTTRPPVVTPAPTPLPMPSRTIGTNPNVKDEDEVITPPPVDQGDGFWADIWADHAPEPRGFQPVPLAGELDERAQTVVVTTTLIMYPPGVELVQMWCPLARDEAAAQNLLCSLRTQCGSITQARMGVVLALIASILAVLAQFAFGAGGGGSTEDGAQAPSKHVPGFAAAALSVGSIGAGAFAYHSAKGVEVPHALEGPGAQCLVLALCVSPAGALMAAAAAMQALFFPGKPEGLEEMVVPDEKEMDAEQLEAARHEATVDEYPGLARGYERPLGLRSAWSPPPPEDQEMKEMAEVAAFEYAEKLGMTKTLDLQAAFSDASSHAYMDSPDEQGSPSEAEVEAVTEPEDGPMMLCLPPMQSEAAPSPASEQSLSRFYEGDGAVYAQRFFGEPSSPLSVASSALSTARSARSFASGGWEKCRSPRSREQYYFHRETGITQWEAPEEWAGRADPEDIARLSTLYIQLRGDLDKLAKVTGCNKKLMRASPPHSPSAWAQDVLEGAYLQDPNDWAIQELRDRLHSNLQVQLPGSPTSGSTFVWKKKRNKRTGQVTSVKKFVNQSESE